MVVSIKAYKEQRTEYGHTRRHQSTSVSEHAPETVRPPATVTSLSQPDDTPATEQENTILDYRFPDHSRAFIWGFEAGLVESALRKSSDRFAPSTPLHVQNRPLFQQMAQAHGFSVEFRNARDPNFIFACFQR